MQTAGARRLPREDDQPWYKQFWPWFLIALPGSVVIAGLTTVGIALRNADDLVVDDYYKSGLAINRRLAREERARELGLAASVQVLDRRLQIRLQGDADLAPLRLQLSHPLEADRDFGIPLQRLAPGLYGGDLPASVEPRWHWTLDGGQDSPWRIDGELSAADFLDGRPG